jgi:hypothetical protein
MHLASVDADCAMLTRMIDLDDSITQAFRSNGLNSCIHEA